MDIDYSIYLVTDRGLLQGRICLLLWQRQSRVSPLFRLQRKGGVQQGVLPDRLKVKELAHSREVPS